MLTQGPSGAAPALASLVPAGDAPPPAGRGRSNAALSDSAEPVPQRGRRGHFTAAAGVCGPLKALAPVQSPWTV